MWLWQGRGRGSGAGLIGGIETPVPVELWEWKMGPIDAYEAVAHPVGTREILFSLEGRVSITVEGTEVTLAEGEGAVFQADRPHRYAAAGGRAARFMMVVIEPLGDARRSFAAARAVKAEGKRPKAGGRRRTTK